MEQPVDNWPESTVASIPSRPKSQQEGSYIEWLLTWLLIIRDVSFVDKWIGPLEIMRIIRRLQRTCKTCHWAMGALAKQVETYLVGRIPRQPQVDGVAGADM